MKEEWKVVKGHAHYSVSSLGRLKNHRGQIIKGTKDRDGYLCVGLSLGERNKKKRMFIHRLVAINFIKTDPFGFRNQVNHINHIKDDNRVSNLEWVTSRENTEKAIEFGVVEMKLSAEDVIEIRKAEINRKSVSALSYKYNVSKSLIRGILNGSLRHNV